MSFGKRAPERAVVIGRKREEIGLSFAQRSLEFWTSSWKRLAVSALLLTMLTSCGYNLAWYAVQSPEELAAYEAAKAQEKAALLRRLNEGAKLERAAAKADAYESGCGSRKTSEAFVMIQSAVAARLKSPSSAVFPWAHNAAVVPGKNCTFEILSYVDAQNSFGATIRTNWAGKIKHDPEAGTWSVLSVSIIE